MDKRPTTGMPKRRVVSVVDSDRGIAETVLLPEGKTVFAVWQSGSCGTSESYVESTGEEVFPIASQNSLLAHRVICLPTQIGHYDGAGELLDNVRAFIHRYADLTPAFEEAASLYVLLSWVYDAFREVPYLRFKGDFGTGKSRCLQVVGSLCYKPMFASGASTVSPLFRIIDTFRGTLVMDEGDFRFSDEKAELIKILNNGNAAGFPVLRSEASPTKEFNPRAFVVFGPKVIATRNLFDDRALESRCITEVMTGMPPRPEVPLSLPGAFEDEATALRNQLLLYRFKNLSVCREKGVPPMPECEPRISQVYAPLMAIAPSAALGARVLAMAQGMSRTIRSERGTTLEAQLLEIVHALWVAKEPLVIGTIAERYGMAYGGDHARPVTPRWVGYQLRSRLGLVATKSRGVFVIGPTECTKLLNLFVRYGSGVVGDIGDVGEVGGSR